MNLRLIDDRQVFAAARLIQIGDHGGLAFAVFNIVWRRAHAVRFRHVEIGALGQAHAVGGVEKGFHRRRCVPFHFERKIALHIERTVFAVDRAIGIILVRLDFFHERQTLLVGPIGIAAGDPLIEIVTLRPQHRHDVDRRAAAHDAAGEGVIGAAVQVALGRIHRDEVGLQEQSRLLRGIGDQLRQRPWVRPRFQQQNFTIRILRKPHGRHATRRPAANNNYVVLVRH